MCISAEKLFIWNISWSAFWGNLCSVLPPHCDVRQVRHVNDLMNYVPITQSEIRKRSILLSDIHFHLIHHCLSASLSFSSPHFCPSSAHFMLYPSHSSKYVGAKVPGLCSSVSFTLLIHAVNVNVYVDSTEQSVRLVSRCLYCHVLTSFLYSFTHFGRTFTHSPEVSEGSSSEVLPSCETSSSTSQ